MQLGVPGQMRAVRECFAAGLALKWPRSGMYASMSMQVATVLETFTTDVANEWTPISVDPRMFHQIAVRVEPLSTRPTCE